MTIERPPSGQPQATEEIAAPHTALAADRTQGASPDGTASDSVEQRPLPSALLHLPPEVSQPQSDDPAQGTPNGSNGISTVPRGPRSSPVVTDRSPATEQGAFPDARPVSQARENQGEEAKYPAWPLRPDEDSHEADQERNRPVGALPISVGHQLPGAAIASASPTRPPTWWHEALLRWEDLWYGRRSRPLLLLVLLLFVACGVYLLLRQPRPSTNPAPTALPSVASSSPAPTFLGATGTPAAIESAAPTPPLPVPPSGLILFQSSQETPTALQLFAISSSSEGLHHIAGTPRNAAHPRISPDGSRIAFVGSDGQADDIYIIGLDGSGLRRITAGSGNNRFPAWSPDGARLAFGSDRDGNWEIYTATLDGSTLTRLTNDPADDNLPSWSPDGQWLAFQSDRARGMHLYKMRVDGGAPIALTGGAGADRYPIWSPDGRRLAYYSDRDGGRDQLFAIDADGGHDTRLAISKGKDQLPAWSPDGQWLVFASERDGGWGIYLLQIATGEQRLLIRQPNAWAPAWGAAR